MQRQVLAVDKVQTEVLHANHEHSQLLPTAIMFLQSNIRCTIFLQSEYVTKNGMNNYYFCATDKTAALQQNSRHPFSICS